VEPERTCSQRRRWAATTASCSSTVAWKARPSSASFPALVQPPRTPPTQRRATAGAPRRGSLWDIGLPAVVGDEDEIGVPRSQPCRQRENDGGDRTIVAPHQDVECEAAAVGVQPNGEVNADISAVHLRCERGTPFANMCDAKGSSTSSQNLFTSIVDTSVGRPLPGRGGRSQGQCFPEAG
jgi:hypothetical protein